MERWGNGGSTVKFSGVLRSAVAGLGCGVDSGCGLGLEVKIKGGSCEIKVGK